VYYTQNLKTKPKVGQSWALINLGILTAFVLNVSLIVANVVTNQVGLFFSLEMMRSDWQTTSIWRLRIG
tara:strand:- start:1414 stop:1620 length:207 start_codon:yes stop_codon:yes gene_type:complete